MLSLAFFTGLLSISVVFAGTIENIVLEFGINNDGEMINEDVGLDYREKCIRINAPAVEGKTPVTVIYDSTEGVTLYRQADHCFLLNTEFGDVFSTDMDDWIQESEEVQIMRVEDTVLYNYTAAPFPLDREYIPSEMQDECDEIYAAMLVNIIRGQAAYHQLQYAEGPFVGRYFGPKSKENENGYRNRDKFRNKRAGASFVPAILKPVLTDILVPAGLDLVRNLIEDVLR